MIVEEIMSKQIISLSPDDSIETANQIIDINKIRHIPIVNDANEVIGMISDRDIRKESLALKDGMAALQKPVSTIMKTDVITGHPLDFVEEAAFAFYEHDIGCMPIISENKLVGIVSESDLLHTFAQLMGADQPNSRIEVKVENKAGVLAEVAAVFRQCKVNIISVFVSPDPLKTSKILVFRIQSMNPTVVIHELKKAGYDVLWPNVPGVSS